MDVESNPGVITDHAFEPRGEWYTTCGAKVPVIVNGQPIGVERICGLGEAAHVDTTLVRPMRSPVPSKHRARWSLGGGFRG